LYYILKSGRYLLQSGKCNHICVTVSCSLFSGNTGYSLNLKGSLSKGNSHCIRTLWGMIYPRCHAEGRACQFMALINTPPSGQTQAVSDRIPYGHCTSYKRFQIQWRPTTAAQSFGTNNICVRVSFKGI